MSICGNVIGGSAPMRTIKIVDADNNEYIGVVVGSEVIFTAVDSDVKAGKVYASNHGLSVGTLEV